MSAVLEITVEGADGSKHSFVSEKRSLMIGRSSANDICLDTDGVSRYHARLSFDGSEIVVEDLGSTNGTFVNAERVEKSAVGAGVPIAIGHAVVTAAVVDDEEEQQAATPEEVVEEAEPVEQEAPTNGAAAAVVEEEVDERIAKEDEFYWKSLQSFLAPIWEYISDDAYSEIMINGPDEIYVEKKGELIRSEIVFAEEKLRAAVLNIAQYVGRRVSEEEPYLDARLPDGSRVAVLLPPCARKGISIAIRKFSKEALTLDKLVNFGSLTPEMVTFLDASVKLKKNIIISGGTSSGKTSLLNVVSGLIPANERILTIEDSAELQLTQDHVLPMETKPPDKKGRGQVTIRDLVKASLRMRPDRVVVGEIRGGEAIDLLQAMNTGHSGSMATVHASSPLQSLNRLETLSLFSGLDIPIHALREQVSTAVDMVIQAARLPDHSRKVTHITEIGKLQPDGTYVVHDIFRFNRTGLSEERKILGQHEWTGTEPSFMEEMELAGLTEALSLFTDKKKKKA